MLDRVQLEEDSSNSVSIRGGRRFLVQEGSAKVMPGSFGLTVVEPNYIYVRPIAYLHSNVFFFGRAGYSLHMCSDSNLKSM